MSAFTLTLYALSMELSAEVGLHSGIVLEMDRDSESAFIARVLSPHGIGSFGVGATQMDAVRDLVEVMGEEASALRARQADLCVDMARELTMLDAVLASGGAGAPRLTAYIGAPMAIGATGPTFAAPLGRNSYFPSSAPPVG